MTAEGWQVRIDRAMVANFKQPYGPSRPGADYQLSLRQGDAVHQILVRAFLGSDSTEAALRDAHRYGQTVIGYVHDRLDGGWTPGEEPYPLPPITILDPAPAPARRGLLARLLRR